jgi:PAS domain S-box-containing protein
MDKADRQNEDLRTALATSRSILRATLESTADGILVTDAGGRVIAHNEKFVQIWGLAHEQVAGAEHAALVALVSHRFRAPERLAGRIRDIYASETEEMFDTLEMTDGRVLERLSRMQRLDDRSVAHVWSYRDITARRRAEDALRDEARVLDLLNQTGRAIASTLELPTLLQTVTDAATQMSGARFGAFFYNTVDASGDAFVLYTLSGAPREAFERFGHPRATPLFGPTFHGQPPIRIDDVRTDPRYGQLPPHFGMPAGHLPVRSYLAVPVLSRGGATIGVLLFGHPDAGVFTERAERLVVGIAAQAAVAIDNARLFEETRRIAEERERLVQAERAAREDIARASRVKDEFLATLSHELRTPLTAILGWSRVLMLKKGDAETLARGVEAIARNAAAQAKLIEDLLDMSRIMSGKVRLEVQPTDLAGVIEAAVDAVRPSADAKELQLRSVLDPLAGPVSGDPGRLQQVVWNLLSNAVKFTPRGGSVEVLLQRVDAQLEIVVRDSGVGIAAEFLPHVFDRFRQADSTTTRSHGGLGLGLAIVKQLVELHGGGVRVDSAGAGHGAVFVVGLPLAAPRASAGHEHPAGERPATPAYDELSLEGLHVLVVDDEPDARELVRQLLGECRAEVSTASSAVQALDMLQRLRPDVLLSDIGMPERDGYQLIRDVRRLPVDQGGRTPAIALTAFARSEDRTRAMLAGYQVHVSKPIEPHELIATVASLAGRMGMA